MILRRILTLFLAFALAFSLTLPAGANTTEVTAESLPPLYKADQVFHLLVQNHLSKPSEAQLTQGALASFNRESAKNQYKPIQPTGSLVAWKDLLSLVEGWQKGTQADWNQINQWLIQGLVESLNDPHTSYFTKEEWKDFTNTIENRVVGFGFQMKREEDAFLIDEVYPQSPAQQAGIQPGDYLLKVNGVSLKGLAMEQLLELIRGEEGTEAILSIYRPSESRSMDISVIRGTFEVPEVSGARFQGDIGYIQVLTFGSEAGKQFQEQLNKLRKKSLKGLIIDLRFNGGGRIEAAEEIASLLMEEGVLMYTTNRNGLEFATWVRNGRDVEIPVRVLVNEWTASASELLAGALRDHNIAKLVGTRTYGKGSAQDSVLLADGDALKVTVIEYLTPTRQKVNGVGLKPDIEVHDDVAQVIETLLSLGVKRVEMRQVQDEVYINGVPFYTEKPLMKLSNNRVMIRKAVYGSLTGIKSIGTEGYTFIPNRKTAKWTSTVVKKKSELVVTFVKH